MSLKPHKWASNIRDALDRVPLEKWAKELVVITDGAMTTDGDSSIRTLGILWNTTQDTFQFFYEPEQPDKIT